MKEPLWTWITKRDLEWGVVQWECYTKADPAPAGMAWVFECKEKGREKDACMVLHSFVHEWARRKGVRTALHEAMKKKYCAVFTWGGTPDGTAWMEAVGAEKTQDWGLWVYNMEEIVRKKMDQEEV